ncbi:N-acetylneuraminate (7)9-O-acetyltransferase-like isoform X2 [Apostichopus japonicus]|uniref:N-acetylneuraminate (7)9-O-acetyltransferase-like isoform X2 n=1 Tax=Stichopus japonicus TaxID=307972 RepID=UPI003AB18810
MLTEQNAKVAASVLVVLFVSHYAFQFWLHGNTTCQDLLTDGIYHSDGKWQPLTCMVHQYRREETAYCLRKKRIVLIGDSRIRQIYDGLLEFHGIQQEVAEKHSNKKYELKEENAIIEFLWNPEVDQSTIDVYKKLLEDDQHPPSLVIHGAAAWTIKLNYASLDALAGYKGNLTKLAGIMQPMAQSSPIIWMMQVPVKREKFDDSRYMITNEVIESYNQAAASALKTSGVNLWYSAEVITREYPGDEEEIDDGLHVATGILNEYLQVLFNWYCNGPTQPKSTTCCMDSRPKPNITQISCFLFFLACSIASAYYYIAIKTQKPPASQSEDKSDSVEPNGTKMEVVVEPSDSAGKETAEALAALENNFKLFWSLTKFGFIMGYFYLCDRTDIFPRVNKHFNILHFAVPLLAFLVYGVWDRKKVKRPDILNVDQTTEWKGWMQLIILVYHFTGASKKIPIYMQLRDIVAAYFFLSGFGQFFVSWSKEKFGLLRVCEVLPIYHYARGGPAAYVFLTAYGQYYSSWERGMMGMLRFCTVVFRYNFFVFFLCLVMDRQYQLYYFVPLITFWYFVIYITMAMIPRATKAKAEEDNKYYYIMIVKLLVLLAVIFVLAFSRTLFDLIFDIPPTNELFRWPGTNLYEWWFRWQLDRYVVPFGMAFSFLLLTSKAKGWIDDSHAGDIFSRKLSIFITLSGLTLHAIHIGRAFFCTDKPSCNRIHVYISFIPILSVVLFRNALGALRTYYSVFFAWVGAMSLELFVGQYHVWLAEDTAGVLNLVPGYPLINVTVTSFIFICVALEVRDISGVVTVAVIPRADKADPSKANRSMLKRLSVFMVLLLILYLYKLSRYM